MHEFSPYFKEKIYRSTLSRNLIIIFIYQNPFLFVYVMPIIILSSSVSALASQNAHDSDEDV